MGSEKEEKKEDEGGSIANAGAWRWLLGLAGPHRGRLAVAAASLVVTTGIGLVVPKLAGTTVDKALAELKVEDMERLIGILVALFAGRGALVFVEVYTLRTSAALVLQSLRTRLHGKLMDLTPAFYESQRTGDLLSRLGNDVDQVAGAITDELIQGADRLLSLVGAVVMLFILHRELTLVMLLAVPPVMVVAVLFGIRLERLSKQRQDAFAAAGVVAEESLSGIRTVQAFTREPDERGRYGERIATATDLAFRTSRAWGLFSGSVSFFAFSAIAIVLGYGGKLVAEKKLSAGDLTSFLMYTVSVAGSVGGLTGLYASMKTAIGATERVRKILDLEPAVKDMPDAVELPRPVRGHVELRDVAFAYASAPERAALRGVRLEAKPGEVVALVGPSGAGKSTIVNLVLRFYDAASGAVTLDAKDVRGVRLASLRQAIGLVPQEIFLFGGTIAENIRYGKPGATDAEMRAAAEAAQAARFIEKLPQGYDSVVGERGVRLSAGERQRIAIARVFLKDPAVVVLDEATSALDAESEHLVSRALERLMAGRTTLVVAHRLSTVRRANKVALVEAGQVVDEAPHAELAARNALYRRLCELQMLPPAEGLPAA